MNSSPKAEDDQVPIVSDAGVPYKPQYRDPTAAWVELMDVVEALCPRWPDREHRIDGVFLL